MNSPSIQLTKTFQFKKVLPVSNFKSKPLDSNNSKKNSISMTKNSSPVCHFKRSSSSPSPSRCVDEGAKCDQKVVKPIKIQNIRDEEEKQENSDDEIIIKSNKSKLLSNSSNSFELLNTEIQNTIKEGKDKNPV